MLNQTSLRVTGELLILVALATLGIGSIIAFVQEASWWPYLGITCQIGVGIGMIHLIGAEALGKLDKILQILNKGASVEKK